MQDGKGMDRRHLSKSELRFAGVAYSVGENEIKVCVNEWLARILVQLRKRQCETVTDSGFSDSSASWVLVLDTEILLTFRTLENLAFIEPHHCVIPNPSAAACEAMIEINPKLRALPFSSSLLLATLQDKKSDLYKELITDGWRNSFQFVWLDYCGTFNSKAGRTRQRDLRVLIENFSGLGESILSITLSQRGSPQLYPLDVVDELILFIHGVTSSCEIYSYLLGVVSYENTTRIASNQRKQNGGIRGSTTMITASFLLSRNQVIQPDTFECMPDDVQGLYYFPGSEWKLLRMYQELQLPPSSLWNAMEYSAMYFSLLVKSTMQVNSQLLILDTKLLPVSRALLIQGISPEKLSVIVNSTLDLLVARELLKILKHEKIKVNCVRPAFMLQSLSNLPLDAVWLSYPSKSFSTQQLQICEHWEDLNFALENFACRNQEDFSCAWLGIDIRLSNTGSIWEHSCVDWVISGVIRAAEGKGIHKSQLRVVHIARYHSNAPCLEIIFCCSGRETQIDISEIDFSQLIEPGELIENEESASSTITSNNSEWKFWPSWNLNRLPKVPVSDSLKYQKITQYLADSVRQFRFHRILLHEPGFHFVLPTLCKEFSGSDFIVYGDSGGDKVAASYLHQLETSAVSGKFAQHSLCTIQFSDILVSDMGLYLLPEAVFLLCDIGCSAWEKKWFSLIETWLAAFSSSSCNLSLAVLFEASNKATAMSLLLKMEERMKSYSFCVFRDPYELYIRNNSMNYVFSLFSIQL